MSDAVATELLKISILGPVVVALGIAVVKLWLKYDEVQKQRVADAQAVTAQMLKVNEQCVTVITTVISTLEAHKESMVEVKDTIKGFGEEMRRLTEEMRRTLTQMTSGSTGRR